jgi:hypothetical protein
MGTKNDEELQDLVDGFERHGKARKLRRSHPYVKDLIEVLKPSAARGLTRRLVLEALKKKRRDTGLPLPEKFDEAVQSVYNQHCVDSLVFTKRKVPMIDGIFFSPGGKGSGLWAVHVDRAELWLKAHCADLALQESPAIPPS